MLHVLLAKAQEYVLPYPEPLPDLQDSRARATALLGDAQETHLTEQESEPIRTLRIDLLADTSKPLGVLRRLDMISLSAVPTGVGGQRSPWRVHTCQK